MGVKVAHSLGMPRSISSSGISKDATKKIESMLKGLHGKALRGGLSVDEIIQFVTKVQDMYNMAKEYAGPVKKLLQNPAVQGISGGKYKPVLEQVIKYMELIGFGRHGGEDSDSDMEGCGNPPLERTNYEDLGFYEDEPRRGRGVRSSVSAMRHNLPMVAAKDVDFLKYMGHPSGGAAYGVSSLSGDGLPKEVHAYLRQKYSHLRGQGFNFEKVKAVAADVFNFFKNNKAIIHAILESDAVNSKVFAPPKDYPRQFAKALGMIGLGEGGRFPGLDLEDCPEGYIDDGLLCRKPIKQVMRKDNLGNPFPSIEGGEVIPKRRKGGAISKATLKSALSGDLRSAMADVASDPRVQSAVSRAKKAVGGRGPSGRGEIVRKVMREHGLSLPQASKYVKEHGLY
jgi:hypothetical protein